MALYRSSRGHSFTKNFIIFNKEKTKILFGLQISIGINADQPQYFNRTNSWFFLGGGFNIKEGELLRGIDLKWNIKDYDFNGKLIK